MFLLSRVSSCSVYIPGNREPLKGNKWGFGTPVIVIVQILVKQRQWKSFAKLFPCWMLGIPDIHLAHGDEPQPQAIHLGLSWSSKRYLLWPCHVFSRLFFIIFLIQNMLSSSGTNPCNQRNMAALLNLLVEMGAFLVVPMAESMHLVQGIPGGVPVGKLVPQSFKSSGSC